MDQELRSAASSLLNHHVNSRKFRAHFGVAFQVADVLWLILKAAGLQYGHDFSPKHLPWALHFLKIYPLQEVGAVFCHCDHKTRNKWVWLVLFTLHITLQMVCA